MNGKSNLIAIALGLLVSLGMLLSCGERLTHSENASTSNFVEMDSLMLVKVRENPQSALTYIDSLEKTEQLDPSVMCYFRGNYYNVLMQRAIAEMFFRKALEGDNLLNVSLELFCRASDYLSVSLSYRGEHAEALTIVTRCYEICHQDKTMAGKRWTAVMLHAMGYFQMQLGMNEDAEKNFSLSYMTLSQMTQADSCYENKRLSARVSFNILDAYITTRQYDKAGEWLNLAESAAENLSKDSECTERDRANSVGGVAIHKALLMLKNGDKSSAEKSYKKAYESGYFNTTTGIMEQTAFLRESEQWDELVDLIPKNDSVARVWNVPLSLYYMKEYMASKFNAYLKSGRKDQAMEVAEMMAASIDSVTSFERNRKMREISVIVAQKDQNEKQAKQETVEAYRWVKILSLALSVLVVCIIVFLVYLLVKSKKINTNIK